MFILQKDHPAGFLKDDVYAAIDAFGKNEHTKKVFRAMFLPMAGPVLSQVLDPGMARQAVEVNTGIGGSGKRIFSIFTV